MTDTHATLTDMVALLKRSDFFSRSLQDDMYWLASKSTLAPRPAGSVLFRSGEIARRFYIVRSGAVVVSRTGDDGRRDEMARFVTGDVLGDFDFSRGAVYDAEATCDEASDILSFPGDGLVMDDLVRERPDVSARVLLRTVAMISSRVRSTQSLISENAPWVRELRRQMYTDSATGLWSRAFLDEELQRSLEPPAAIVLCKPDRFKELCDTWTHAAGDAAMERIAALLKEEARAMRKAWAVRLRGNEAAIVVSGCRPDAAEALALRLAAAYRDLDLSSITGSRAFKLSASLALSHWPRDGADLRGLVEQTYGLMTRAWKDGGDRIYRLDGSPELGQGSPEGSHGSPELSR